MRNTVLRSGACERATQPCVPGRAERSGFGGYPALACNVSRRTSAWSWRTPAPCWSTTTAATPASSSILDRARPTITAGRMDRIGTLPSASAGAGAGPASATASSHRTPTSSPRLSARGRPRCGLPCRIRLAGVARLHLGLCLLASRHLRGKLTDERVEARRGCRRLGFVAGRHCGCWSGSH